MISYHWPLRGSNFPPCRCEACPVKTFASGYLGRWLVVAPGVGKIWLNDLGIITCLRRNRISQFIGNPPEKWTYPLKIDGWKMTFPFKMTAFGWPILLTEKGAKFHTVVCPEVSLHSLWGLSARTSQLWGTWMLWGLSYGARNHFCNRTYQLIFTRWEGYSLITVFNC